MSDFWNKFIDKGFERITEVQNAKKELQSFTAQLTPRDDQLFVRWRKKGFIKEFVVCCTCGNSRMLMHENGVRCHLCGRYHTHDAFRKKSREVRKMAMYEGGTIEIQQQPLKHQYETRT